MKAVNTPAILGKAFLPSLALALVLSAMLSSCGSRKPVANTETLLENPVKETHLNIESTTNGLDTVVILSINDPHAALDQVPRFAFMVDSIRTLYPNLLFLSGGDLQSGDPINDQYSPKGYPIIGLMNALGCSFSVVGNHEFDPGQEEFGLLTKVALFPFLAANVFPDEKFGIDLKPYSIKTLPNGRKVAILGLLQLEENGLPSTHPDKVKGIRFEYARDITPNYRKLKDSADIVVALTHLGIEEDKEIAKANPWIDLIVGGHSHTFIDNALMVGEVPITQSGARLKQAAITFILLDADGRIVETKVHSFPVDKAAGLEKPEIRAYVDKLYDNPVYREELAITEKELENTTQIGYLMCDAYRAETGSDFSFQNNGGVRLSQIPKGAITLLDLFVLDPFGNEMKTIYLTPKEIRNFLSYAWEKEENEPILTSGLQLTYFLNPDGTFEKVEITDENGNKLDEKKRYKVAYSNYIEAAYPFEHKEVSHSEGYTTAEATIRYLRKIGKVDDYSGKQRSQVIREKK